MPRRKAARAYCLRATRQVVRHASNSIPTAPPPVRQPPSLHKPVASLSLRGRTKCRAQKLHQPPHARRKIGTPSLAFKGTRGALQDPRTSRLAFFHRNTRPANLLAAPIGSIYQFLPFEQSEKL